MKTVFICDPGIDDALALFILTKLKKSPSYIIASYGNAPLSDTYRNALLLKQYYPMNSVVIRGSEKKLSGEETQFDNFHRSDGLGGNAKKLSDEFSTIEDESVSIEGEVDIFSTGPATDLVKFIEHYDKAKINRIFVMGGGLKKTNSPHNTEYNFFSDPIAVQKLFSSDLNITIFPLDITLSYPVTNKNIRTLESVGKYDYLINMLDFANKSFENNCNGAIVHDAFPVLYYLYPDKFKTEKKKLKCDEFGHIYEDLNGSEINVAVSMEKNLLFDSLESAFNR